MSENAPADGPSSPLATVAETFRKLWLALATIPSEAINDPRHPRWDESFRRAGPLAVEFEAAVSEARRTPGVLAPVAGDAIRQAESLVAELVERLIARSPNRLPGLLAPECIRIGNALKNLAAMQPTSIPTAERSQEAPQADARGRGAEDLRQDADPPKKADPGQPSLDRQSDIITTIRAAQMPLTRPELLDKMGIKREGKLGANLAWMVSNNILIKVLNRGYWPAGEKVPE